DTEVAAQGQRKTYEVLPEGRDELVRWVGESHDPRPLRDPLLLRLRAAAIVGVGGLEVELARLLALHQGELQNYLAIEQRDFAGELTDAGTLQHLVLQAGIGMRAFCVEWLTSALEAVRNLEG
ncbi:MAG: PadR family transcriptional regulator, partial [Nocardiaceae bacterium]|nr:PadR family transcriptional regulator [Nocardiaceae bacterium]